MTSEIPIACKEVCFYHQFITVFVQPLLPVCSFCFINEGIDIEIRFAFAECFLVLFCTVAGYNISLNVYNVEDISISLFCLLSDVSQQFL